jgi:hypothetical protein
MITHVMPQGTTEPQGFELSADGAVVNLTGLTVGIEVKDKDKTIVTSPGTVSVVNASLGLVQLVPNPAKFSVAKSPYFVRWTVTNGASMFKVPNSLIADIWQVPLP